MQDASSPGFLMHLFVSMVVATEMTPQRRVRMSCLPGKGSQLHRGGESKRGIYGAGSISVSSSARKSNSKIEQLLILIGSHGGGEKPTRGELVRSTHGVPSPFLSSYDFSLKPFL